MNNRSEVLKEYYELIQKLNSTNRTKNQKTELHFYIYESTHGKHHLRATANFEKFLTVGEIVNGTTLKADADFEFRNLAEYFRKELQKSQQTKEDINLTVRLIISRLFSI